MLGTMIWYTINTKTEFISPLADDVIVMERIVIHTLPAEENLDTWVEQASEKFTDNAVAKSILKAKLHFLLSKESKHGLSKNCGDGGKSCGPLQFWESTWIGYRKLMIKEGVAEEIGDRFNMKQAIFTTAWAIADGRELAWGPIKRGEIKI